jgi:hypothetical protein
MPASLGTRIQDTIIPEVYTPYLWQKVIERSAIIQSSVTSQNTIRAHIEGMLSQ